MWPKNVTASRELLPGGAAAYRLKHDQVGELGRIVLQPGPNGGTIVTHEVWSSTDDGQHDERVRILTGVKDIVMSALAKGR